MSIQDTQRILELERRIERLDGVVCKLAREFEQLELIVLQAAPQKVDQPKVKRG